MIGTEVTLETARKVAEVVGKGLCAGMGKPEPGKMCVEAAVCYAMGLPHSDEPPCVSDAVRAVKIQLNDSKWSSDRARGAGMLAVAVGQLGSKGVVDDQRFVEMFLWRVVREIVCPFFDKIGLPAHAEAMRSADTLDSLERSAVTANKLCDDALAANVADCVAKAAYAADHAFYANAAAFYAASAAPNADETLYTNHWHPYGLPPRMWQPRRSPVGSVGGRRGGDSMTDKIRILMIAARRYRLPAWISDDRQAIVVRREYPSTSSVKSKPVDFRVENMRQLHNLLGG
jgi:hypothetical protein